MENYNYIEIKGRVGGHIDYITFAGEKIGVEFKVTVKGCEDGLHAAGPSTSGEVFRVTAMTYFGAPTGGLEARAFGPIHVKGQYIHGRIEATSVEFLEDKED